MFLSLDGGRTRMSNTQLSPVHGWRRSRYGLAGFFLLSFLVFNSILRLVLFFAFRTDLAVTWTAAVQTFSIGLYRDFFVGLVMAVPLLFWLLMVRNRWFGKRWHRVLMGGG